jgi:hypothetical protein
MAEYWSCDVVAASAAVEAAVPESTQVCRFRLLHDLPHFCHGEALLSFIHCLVSLAWQDLFVDRIGGCLQGTCSLTIVEQLRHVLLTRFSLHKRIQILVDNQNVVAAAVGAVAGVDMPVTCGAV